MNQTDFKFRTNDYPLLLEAMLGKEAKWESVLHTHLAATEEAMEALNRQYVTHDNMPPDRPPTLPA